ncbi:hypothetical protein COY32_02040 [candidate division WWE3 bacterium CG_4_10_14_0_2_um_filter_41_14]|uniref:Sortase n=1 Tax=candidate division WWE3 bacterium CG_4_10_14_0_2_um_filter_41_14 TaxID=1975072 RepID=A0A2M7TKE8_UNCKA|nr:MAG: hypothetical protein COY32_02040 [candidate division WWE3 bacterium CG_4_10_14_0_2_um_filter_41_14]
MKKPVLFSSISLERGIFILRGVGIGAIIIGFIGMLGALYPVISSEINYELQSRKDPLPTPTPQSGSFGEVLVIAPPLSVQPINTTHSIIIQNIEVNSPIVWDVPVTDEKAYNAALANGVAHAQNTSHPSSENGNTYLFAHSTLNPLDIQKYSAVFTLLHRLNIGDRVTVFNDNVRYDYAVEAKDVVKDFDVTPLTREPDYPMLTLQTCDPPGIPLNRLIITARLVGQYPLAEK